MGPGHSKHLRWMAFGMLCMQIGWILLLPPFRGSDEFDHAYRADALAHGEWVSSPASATRGTGAYLNVSPELVAAARPECQRLRYTTSSDCVGESTGGRVLVASGAGRYPPTYYALVSLPALVFEGYGALYAMRVASALLCVSLIMWGMTRLGTWASPLGQLAVVLCTTPVVFYSTAVVAPNGLEIAAGLAFWIALAGLAREEVASRGDLLLAFVAGGLLVSLRPLGPLWAVLSLGTALVCWPHLRRSATMILRSTAGKRLLLAAALISCASVTWILSQRSLTVGAVENRALLWGTRFEETLGELFLWPFQAIAAFPYRDQPAPMLVYPVCLTLLVSVLGFAFIRSGRPQQLGLLTVIALSFLVPAIITLMTIDDFGTAWQGRYAMPYLIGAAVIAAATLGATRRFGYRAGVPVVVLFVVGHLLGPIAVVSDEARTSPLAGTTSWLQPSPAAIGVLVAVAALMMTAPLAKLAVDCSREYQ